MILAFQVDLGSALGIFLAALAACATIGGVIAVLKVNILKTTADLYRQDNEAHRARMETMEKDGIEKDKLLAAANAKVVEKEREVVTLRDMVTGTSAIDRLADNMAGHFAITEALLRHAVGEDVFQEAARERDRVRDQARSDRRGGQRQGDQQP